MASFLYRICLSFLVLKNVFCGERKQLSFRTSSYHSEPYLTVDQITTFSTASFSNKTASTINSYKTIGIILLFFPEYSLQVNCVLLHVCIYTFDSVCKHSGNYNWVIRGDLVTKGQEECMEIQYAHRMKICLKKLIKSCILLRVWKDDHHFVS